MPDAQALGCPNPRMHDRASPCGLDISQLLDPPRVPPHQHMVPAPFQHHRALAQPELKYDNLPDHRHEWVLCCNFS